MVMQIDYKKSESIILRNMETGLNKSWTMLRHSIDSVLNPEDYVLDRLLELRGHNDNILFTFRHQDSSIRLIFKDFTSASSEFQIAVSRLTTHKCNLSEMTSARHHFLRELSLASFSWSQNFDCFFCDPPRLFFYLPFSNEKHPHVNNYPQRSYRDLFTVPTEDLAHVRTSSFCKNLARKAENGSLLLLHTNLRQQRSALYFVPQDSVNSEFLSLVSMAADKRLVLLHFTSLFLV